MKWAEDTGSLEYKHAAPSRASAEMRSESEFAMFCSVREAPRALALSRSRAALAPALDVASIAVQRKRGASPTTRS